ncbi:MAG: hypothetical protein LAO78_26880 [Acidobacteriia bacterium]|nr:hypothetical protein [Terriglobia bacterium]
MWLAQPVFAQAPAVSEEKPPLILLQALHCLEANQGWMRSYLRKHKDAWVSFSVDTGNPPEVVAWTIVVRESELRGHFFEVTRENDHGTMVFRLLDSDGFTTKPGKLEFDRLFPLSWKYFERRIKDALQNQRFVISASEIQYQQGSYTCDCTRH